ncbi:MAG: hypothetical protein PHZ26_05430 [Candidatus Gracilibacteria bacterium]|nr:hypothetical protein [Candidatus Gracilibacteria bacterium]MDD2909157.1 hypothetical protein [Candidatus Gracilibacteria bacterium]
MQKEEINLKKMIALSALMALAISSTAFAADTGPPVLNQGIYISNLGQPLAAHPATFVAILASQPIVALAQSTTLTVIPLVATVATQQAGILGGGVMACSSQILAGQIIIAQSTDKSGYVLGGDKRASALDIVTGFQLGNELGFAATG